MKVLLVEDEERLALFVQKGLEAESYRVDVAYDGYVGKQLFTHNEYDAVILDINLPQINGIELCRQFKADNSSMPILMLTALDSLDDKMNGFNAGADDYLPKPFEFIELLARLRAITKRYNVNNQSVVRLADLELNLNTKVVTRHGQRIDLTTKEHALLEYLMAHSGKIISRAELAEKVWDLSFYTSTNVIDVYVSYLRKKIDRDFSPKLLHTVVGMGYVLREN
ncbi:response regulator transcription factor [Spirosoma pomorum]|jgi:two-component system copper resistance phosphate regulon response regulator CusR